MTRHRRALPRAILPWLLAAMAAIAGLSAWARQPPRTLDRLDTVAVEALPQEARDTLWRIKHGGPFPYRKDGTTFQNRERRLPPRYRGYYREYTVRTPYAADRGARRIIAGQGMTGDVRTSGEYYYTGDHYRSFRRIEE
jgi:ribonuclease T1